MKGQIEQTPAEWGKEKREGPRKPTLGDIQRKYEEIHIITNDIVGSLAKIFAELSGNPHQVMTRTGPEGKSATEGILGNMTDKLQLIVSQGQDAKKILSDLERICLDSERA